MTQPFLVTAPASPLSRFHPPHCIPRDAFTTLAQMACREFRLDAGGSSNLILKHKRTVVDLSQPFRFTGIPQNATLELTVRSQALAVKIQIFPVGSTPTGDPRLARAAPADTHAQRDQASTHRVDIFVGRVFPRWAVEMARW